MLTNTVGFYFITLIYEGKTGKNKRENNSSESIFFYYCNNRNVFREDE